MEYKYLISRVADPVIAVAIGTAAYFVHEKRIGREKGHTLKELVLLQYRKSS